MKKYLRIGGNLIVAALALIPVAVFAQTITSFDPKGSIYTVATGINAEGAIAGYFIDAANKTHAFLRSPGGKITTFDGPSSGANRSFGIAESTVSINAIGLVTGTYGDVNGVTHGFVRLPDGSIFGFRDANAGLGAGQGTSPAGINVAGLITGSYTDQLFNSFGFARTADGAVKSFDAPGALSTTPTSVNSAGVIAGTYSDQSGNDIGFLRSRNGNITTFSVAVFSLSGAPFTATFVNGINDSAAIAGSFLSDINTFAYLGFVRNADGTTATFDGQTGANAPSLKTSVTSINAAGTVTGTYVDSSFVTHSFVRARNGHILDFDFPASAAGLSMSTYANSINDEGAVTGNYTDAMGISHGFVRTQRCDAQDE